MSIDQKQLRFFSQTSDRLPTPEATTAAATQQRVETFAAKLRAVGIDPDQEV